MSFGSLGYSKLDYARTIVASLAWLMNRQGDAVGLSVFDERVRLVVPARYRPGQLRRIMVNLESKTSGKETNPEQALEHAARRLNRRGFVVLISDLLAPAEQFEAGLKLLRGCGHDVVVFQVLDPVELDLKISGPRLFEDLETRQKIYADPNQAGEAFTERMTEHNNAVQAACEKLGAAFVRTVTNEPPELALSEFLHARRLRR